MKALNNKVIIVTGGTGILGGSIVKAIADAGGIAVILGRNKERLQQKQIEITQSGGRAFAVAADVMIEAQLEEAKAKILAAYGSIDGLVNAAGGNIPEAVVQPSDNIFEMNLSGMKKALELNLWGTITPTQIFGREMQTNGGSIINISSVSAKTVLTKVLGYSMGKSAIDRYTQWFAVEAANRHGDKIRMNAIVPGFFLTEQNRTLLTNADGTLTARGEKIIAATPYSRFGSPEELNGAAVWLLSDASKFVTGTSITIDGGFSVFGGV